MFDYQRPPTPFLLSDLSLPLAPSLPSGANVGHGIIQETPPPDHHHHHHHHHHQHQSSIIIHHDAWSTIVHLPNPFHLDAHAAKGSHTWIHLHTRLLQARPPVVGGWFYESSPKTIPTIGIKALKIIFQFGNPHKPLFATVTALGGVYPTACRHLLLLRPQGPKTTTTTSELHLHNSPRSNSG